MTIIYNLNANHLKIKETSEFWYKLVSEDKNKSFLFDTFNNKLKKNKKYLIYNDGYLNLKDLKTNKTIYNCEIDLKDKYEFNDFPDSELRKYIQDKISTRAIIKLFEYSYTEKNYEIYNYKNRLQFNIKHLLLNNKDISNKISLILIDVSKYKKKRIKRIIPQIIENQTSFVETDFYNLLTEKIKLPNKYYNKKINFDIDPENNFNLSAEYILNELTKQMYVNFDGVINDYDTEFLHDYRVAVRRIRSFISYYKKYLPEQIKEFGDLFKTIHTKTSTLRDLDVTIIKKHILKEMLPQDAQIIFEEFIEKIKIDRKLEFNKVKNFIKSPYYRTILKDWHNFLEKLKKTNNKYKTCKVVKNVLIDRTKQIFDFGKKLSVDTEDEFFHKMRISFKKLRYNLEFFKQFFPKSLFKKTLKRYKKMQDYLGNLNDLTFYEEFTIKYFDYKKTDEQDFTEIKKQILDKINFSKHSYKKKVYEYYKKLLRDTINIVY